MTPPRGLSAAEAALWRQVTATVTPLEPTPREPMPRGKISAPLPGASVLPLPAPVRARGRVPPPLAAPPPPTASPAPGLDAAWERKLARAAVVPDFTIDLHGCTLDQAHRRLDGGLIQAKAMGARLVLLIAGKSRPVDPADRGTRRGAIRAKVLDWLAAGPHGADIAAVRAAHRRHGGDGALYLVMRRPR